MRLRDNWTTDAIFALLSLILLGVVVIGWLVWAGVDEWSIEFDGRPAIRNVP